jgi:hypothetical protein
LGEVSGNLHKRVKTSTDFSYVSGHGTSTGSGLSTPLFAVNDCQEQVGWGEE